MKSCPACASCGHSFAGEEKIAVVEPFPAQAALFPTIILRGRLIPQEIQLSAEKTVIKSWGWFWDGIEIQTPELLTYLSRISQSVALGWYTPHRWRGSGLRTVVFRTHRRQRVNFLTK